MATVAATRLREDAQEVRWVLFVDGIPLVWTTDNGQGGIGSLLGTGPTSWIGRSEALLAEEIGTRSVVSGLEVPPTFTESIDIKASGLDPNPVVFKLHDDGQGTLAALFSREDKPFDILRERLPPGLGALPVTALGTTGAIGIWGRNVGIERVGAAGQRRQLPALPEALVGFDHAVHQDVAGPGELPPIKVSDDPLQFAGRLFSLWSIYRDPDSKATDATAWPTWDKQTANLRLVGKVLNFRRQRGRVFEMQCHGRDSLYRKTLGRVSTALWQPISADRPRTATDSGFAVIFEARGSDAGVVVFNGSVLDHDLTAGDKGGIGDEISAIIADAVDGTSTNYTTGGGGDLVDWEVPVADNQEADAGIDSAEFWVRKVDQAGNQKRLVMFVIMHSRDWRRLGYEPETQHFDTVHNATENGFQISFRQLVAGEEAKGTFDTGFLVPDDGYWRGRFSTVKVGGSEGLDGSNDWDNDGSKRYYKPKFSGSPFTIDLTAVGQRMRLGGGISPFLEGQLTVHHTGGLVDAVPSERARYFALRGKVQRLTTGSGGAIVLADVETTVQVAKLEWVEGNYGNVDPGFGAIPVTILTQWMDPRLFGFNHKPLEGLEYWSGVSGGEGQIDALPLNAYAYQGNDTPEFAHSLWSQILLSTGSGGGYVGDVITDGDNAPAGIVDQDLFWGSDLALADLGCAVPKSLVAPLEDIRDAFATVPGGSGGPLNRVRYAYAGPFLAQEMLASLMRPRRLIWRLHGDELGLVKLAPFSPGDADVTINQEDLYGDDDPRSLEPVQSPNPVGSLDGVELAFRWNPETSKTAESWIVRSQDAEAGARTGELVQQLAEHGLVAWDWGVPEGLGVGDWREDFRVAWAFDAAEFLSLDHYAITLTVSRPKGQDLRPGTRVLFNNPWPYNNGGGYGLVNHVAIVTAITVDTSTHAVETELFVFAGQAQGVRHFGPGPRVLEQVGSVLTLSDDQYLHGDPLANDADGFVEPPWSSAGGAARVQLLCRIGESWSFGSMHAVSSFDELTNELTLTAPPTTDREYADRWLVLIAHDGQAPGTFPRAIYGAIALGDLTHGSVPTVAKPFHP
jgi:hypothetical protein